MTALRQEALLTHPCSSCGKEEAEGYPHHHETPLNPSHNPMPPKPASLGVTLWIMRREYVAELPVRLHVMYVPNRTEPIIIADANEEITAEEQRMPPEYRADYRKTIEVQDTGELGAPSWSPQAHRRFGGVTGWGQEWTVSAADYAIFPWTHSIHGLRRWCWGHHRTWYEHQGRPLCWSLLVHVICGGYSIERAGQLEGISPEKALSLVSEAANKVWVWTSNTLNEIDMRRTA